MDRKQLDKFLKYYWLNLGDVNKLKLNNPLEDYKIGKEDGPKEILRMMRKPEFSYFLFKHLMGKELSPIQLVLQDELWKRPFPMIICNRGFGKTFNLGVYCIRRAVLDQGAKIVIAGSGFRQSKLVFEVCEKIWYGSEILQDLFSGYNKNQGPKYHNDRVVLTLGESTITAIPVGTGEKIRGLRASHLIVDEFASINPQTFEVVISGFGAVSSDPIESMRTCGKIRAMKELNKDFDATTIQNKSNQLVISGTADYAFKHFAKYWGTWRNIILSGGDKMKLRDALGRPVEDNFNWRDYSLFRIPVDLMPEGYMDEKNISRQRVSLSEPNFIMEYGACFVKDSNGFYKRSMIEQCVAREENPIDVNGEFVTFKATMVGKPDKKYVFGIDPASERDLFSIVILEVYPTHNRIVYCWTTNRKIILEKGKKEKAYQKQFHNYCARKIRDLMKVFPCERIGMDTQGGGYGIEEALRDKEQLEDGEYRIMPIIDPDKEKPTDDISGLHILEQISFAQAKWTSDANHLMRKDFENKLLLFPDFDAATYAITTEQQDLTKDESENETIADVMMEVEELKDELSSIVYTQTSIAGREHWDTPETKDAIASKKGRLRKDRYTALLIANSVSRSLKSTPKPVDYDKFVSVVQPEKEIEKDKGLTEIVREDSDEYPDWLRGSDNFWTTVSR